jgi:hypothetical protein
MENAPLDTPESDSDKDKKKKSRKGFLELVESSPKKTDQPAVEKAAEKVIVRQDAKAERATERRRAPEARQLHATTHHELIGHVLITAESKPAGRSEKPAELPKNLTERRIETLNRAELFSLSEKIIVDGSSLRQIYETHLIGERGLRRLVAEHLRGGDLKKALRQEIVEREIDFERDPGLRDMASYTVSSGGGAPGGNAALNKMFEKAAASLPANREEAAYLKARVAYETRQQEQQKKQRRLVDVSIITAVLILSGLVIFLVIIRR